MLRIAERASVLSSEAVTQGLLENAYNQWTGKALIGWTIDPTDTTNGQSRSFCASCGATSDHYTILLSEEEIDTCSYDQVEIGPYHDSNEPPVLFQDESPPTISSLSDGLHYAQVEGNLNDEAIISNSSRPVLLYVVNHWDLIPASQNASDWSNTNRYGVENESQELDSSYASHFQFLLPRSESLRLPQVECDTTSRAEAEIHLQPEV